MTPEQLAEIRRQNLIDGGRSCCPACDSVVELVDQHIALMARAAAAEARVAALEAALCEANVLLSLEMETGTVNHDAVLDVGN